MLKALQIFSVYVTIPVLKRKQILKVTQRYCSNVAKEIDCLKEKTMKVLNVAEKNDAAKNIAGHISRGTARRREGMSKFNKIYEFNARVWNQDCQMTMTSVSGHLMGFDFQGAYRKWYGCPPLSLFDAPVVKQCPEASYEKIKKTIEKEVKSCQALIIWTDCDREGENIGFEIINVCQAVKPNIRVYRAKFSEITQISIDRALQNLEEPNKALSDAVDVRSELDLRIGAAFTRFQTMRLQKAFPRNLAEMLISYGPCQFPTLGFVVERFLAIERFESEPYWKLKVTHTQNDLTVDFRWSRNRLFEKLPCEVFLDICLENPKATVEKVTSKPKSKWRPLPLDTVELEKQGSRKLRLTAKETMKTAEKLYSQGFISYPRTETNIFPKEMDLVPLVTQQTAQNAPWSEFAQQVLQDGLAPRQGKKSDQAHPPIHPTKYVDSLQGNEAKVYEFVVRHFLACLSKNAEGYETIVEIDIAGEKFLTNGLQIIAKNYLEVYIYEKWNAKEIHIYEQGQTFEPTSIEMLEEATQPPNLLTEADLIALMDKHGIGTDATHAEHIETIKSRKYVGLRDQKFLIPGKLGIGLVMGYDRMGFQMSKPHLRAELENDLKLICDRVKDPDEVRRCQIDKYREVFREALVKANLIDGALAEYLDEQPTTLQAEDIPEPVEELPILKCPKCNSNMTLKKKRQGNGKYIGCMAYPTCNNVIWFPEGVEDVEVLDERCNQCPDTILKKLKFKLARNAFPVFGTNYSTCIGGCDRMFNDLIGIRPHTIRRVQNLEDTGYGSNASTGSSVSQSSNNPRNPQTNQRSQTTAASNRNQQGHNQTGNAANNFSGSSWNSSGNNASASSQSRNTNTWNQSNNNSRSNDFPGSGSSWNSSGNNANTNNQNRNANTWNQSNNNSRGNDFSGSSWGGNSASGNQNRSNNTWISKDNNFSGSSRSGVSTSTSSSNQNGSTNQGWNAPSSSTSTSNAGSSNNPTFNWDGEDGGEIMCNCHELAKQLTVRKDGPNQGRTFYKCAKPVGEDCNFFLWGSETGASTSGGVVSAAQRPAPNNWNQDQNFQNNRNNNQNSNNWQSSRNTHNGSGNWDDGGGQNNDELMCTCGNPARKLTVHKEGPNKGRQFYGCPQGVGSPCNFFQWADENDDGHGGASSSRGQQDSWGGPPSSRGKGRTRGGGATGGSAPKKARTTSAGGGTKRKCGVCGVEGHTKRTCPQNAMD